MSRLLLLTALVAVLGVVVMVPAPVPAVQPAPPSPPGVPKPEDELVFKVPSLRNVTLTAPYFHDGSVDQLPEAVRRMGRHQLGKELSDADIGRIVSFLKTLEGDFDPALVEAPALP